jgi:hypothetical protein
MCNDDDDELTPTEMAKVYKNINNALNSEFAEELSDVELNAEISKKFLSVVGGNDVNHLMENIGNEVRDITLKTEQLSNSLTIARIHDAEFLEREMKSVMLSSRRVLETVEKDIKIGSSPRSVEVYSGLITAITGQFKELRNLNESMAKLVLENKKQNLDEVKEDHKMILSSNDALDMYMNARTNSQMNSIDADFDIINDE